MRVPSHQEKKSGNRSLRRSKGYCACFIILLRIFFHEKYAISFKLTEITELYMPTKRYIKVFLLRVKKNESLCAFSSEVVNKRLRSRRRGFSKRAAPFRAGTPKFD